MKPTRQQIINLINDYIYPNGNQRITADQLNEILIAIANAFAMDGGAASGIDGVLAAGSNVSKDREIKNETGGRLKLSASEVFQRLLLYFQGLNVSDGEYEGAVYCSKGFNFTGNIKRNKASTRDIFQVIDEPDPNEVFAITMHNTLAEYYNDDNRNRADDSRYLVPGVASIAKAGNGFAFHHVGFKEINTGVRVEDNATMSFQESTLKQRIDRISLDIVSGPQSTSHIQTPGSIRSEVSSNDRNTFVSNLNPGSQTWGDGNGVMAEITRNALKLAENVKLGLVSGKTAGLVNLKEGKAQVVSDFVTEESVISLTVQPGGNYSGNLRVSAITPGQGFEIASSNTSDSCKVFWQIIDLNKY